MSIYTCSLFPLTLELTVVIRYAFATVTFQNDLDALKQVHNISLAVFDDNEDAKDVTWNLVYESLPSDYQNFGPNPMGLNYSSTDRIGTLHSISYNEYLTDSPQPSSSLHHGSMTSTTNS